MLLSLAAALILRRLGRRRAIRLVLLVFVLFNVVDVTRVHRRLAREHELYAVRQRQRPTTTTMTTTTGGAGGERVRGGRERVYIAGLHFEDGGAGQRRRRRWSSAVLELTEWLGADNVYVGILEESGGGGGGIDGGDEVLRDLARQLESRGVAHRVDGFNVTTQADEVGRDGQDGIETLGKISRIKTRMTTKSEELHRRRRRIPSLAGLRNKTLQDLVDLYKKGVTFDKILFLNDVVFTTDDVVALMDTNDGVYAAACALDFSGPDRYHDVSLAMRDAEGSAQIMQTWPYFRAAESRSALVKNQEAVPMRSCWSGMVVMSADPFVSPTKLRFRDMPDSLARMHLEASECCLVHADNPLSRTLGVYVNPRVRVGSDLAAYEATHPSSSSSSSWVSAPRILAGLWENRVRRWASRLGVWERSIVGSRVAAWQTENMSRHEPGVFCLADEMRIHG